MHKYHYCGYHIKNFGDRDLSMKSTISELAPMNLYNMAWILKQLLHPKL